ncbi:MAG: DUF262 domain-containing protein [Gammaproteobacteria bacterium]|nr:DUF262 domain-containing protein [Gammaproteobacteria bacterium]
METQNKNEDEKIEGLDNAPSESWGDYPLDTVFVRKEPRTVGDIVSRIDKGRYKLDPDFQRDFVWNLTKQSRLIESSLMRIPLPVLYVAEDTDGKIIVVDGLQRLTTFHRYLNNKFALKDVGSSDPESVISGKKFDALPIHLQERIEDTQLTLYILDPKAPERARLDIFERVNSGEPLTRQQMRNCLYSGESTRWLKKASHMDCFLKATGRSLKIKSMRDREVINRFCAFYILGFDSYKGDMEEFLAEALTSMNEMDEDSLAEMKEAFSSAMELSYKLFGKHSFRKSLAKNNGDDSRSVLNISLFDALASQLALNQRFLKDIHPNLVKERICKLMEYSKFTSAISYSTNNTIEAKARHRLANKMLSTAEKVSIDEIIYLDIIEEHFKYIKKSIYSEKACQIARHFYSEIEEVKQFTDWSVKENLLSEIYFKVVLVLEPYELNEVQTTLLISKLMEQAKEYNVSKG